MGGKWADGIEPRQLDWLVSGRLAFCERPGGVGSDYRRVRRQEEILWLVLHEFKRIVTLTDAPVNVHAYEEKGLRVVHLPWPAGGPDAAYLRDVHAELTAGLAAADKMLLHKDGVDDDFTGILGSLLVLSGRTKNAPQAIALTERLVKRRLGVGALAVIELAAEIVAPGGAQSADSAQSSDAAQ